jgi:hypothetical protein
VSLEVLLYRSILTAFAILIVDVGSAHSQRLQASFNVEIGSVVQIRDTSGISHRGKLLKVTSDTLGIMAERGSRSIPIAALDSLWIRRSRASKFARVGAIVGGGIGALIAIDFVRFNCDSGVSCSGDYLKVVPIGAAVVGFLGAMTGGVIGSVVHSWELVHPN